MADEKPQEGPKPLPKKFARSADIAFGLAALAMLCVIATVILFTHELIWPHRTSVYDLVWDAALILIVATLIVGGVAKRRIRASDNNLRGIGTARASQILVVLAYIVGAGVLTLPCFMEAQLRAKVSRALSDMRSVRVAIDAYRAHFESYPAAAVGVDSVNGSDRLPSFHLTRDVTLLKTLTTPVNYLATRPDLHGYPRDPFAPERQATFAYYATKSPVEGWILTSAGPDRDYDIDPTLDYDPATTQPSPHLLHLSYDPTNGTVSNGDIWRVRQ